MALKAENITGTLEVGGGRETPLFCASARRLDGGVELLLSAEGRHVWITLDTASAEKLAALLTRKE